jgi:hypothetical protein
MKNFQQNLLIVLALALCGLCMNKPSSAMKSAC